MTTTPATPASSPTPLLAQAARHMSLVWATAVLIALVLGFGMNPIAVVTAMLQEQGVTDAQAQATAFAAGFTLPVVVGTLVVVLLVGSGAMARLEGPNQAILITLIFAAAGVLSAVFGLGLAPDFAGTKLVGGPPFLSLPLFVLQAYLSRYGFPLLFVGLAIGAAAGLQAYRWSGMAPDSD